MAIPIKDDKTYILCKHCGHYEEVNKKLFAKIIGGAVAGFGFWAWVSFFFAGCGFALPLCIAIVTGGVAMAAYAKEIGDWMSKKYDCPGCAHRDWIVLTGKELRLQSEVEKSSKTSKVSHSTYSQSKNPHFRNCWSCRKTFDANGYGVERISGTNYYKCPYCGAGEPPWESEM